MTILDRARGYILNVEERTLTIRELAEILGCNECYLSRTLKPHLNRVESSTKSREKARKLAESRREMRKRHAIAVNLGLKSLKRAAADARCSERTIRRYMKD